MRAHSKTTKRSKSPVLKGGRFPSVDHDHGHCIETALMQAEDLCAARAVRLTDTRKRVLELVWQSHNPIGAYDVLERLNNEPKGAKKKAQPPTVYRALEFLLDQGLIHRIESLNAYVGCRAPEHDHAGQFLICRDCGVAAELIDEGLEAAIDKRAKAAGFAVDHPTIELEGRCAECRKAGKAKARGNVE